MDLADVWSVINVQKQVYDGVAACAAWDELLVMAALHVSDVVVGDRVASCHENFSFIDGVHAEVEGDHTVAAVNSGKGLFIDAWLGIGGAIPRVISTGGNVERGSIGRPYTDDDHVAVDSAECVGGDITEVPTIMVKADRFTIIG